MDNTISNYSQTKDNNFNLIRFIAAFLVLFSHSFITTTGDPNTVPLRLLLDTSWGGIAVDVFFITSGFLIAGSFCNKKGLVPFIWARVLRIYPALIVAMFISVFILGMWFTTLKPIEYLSSPETYKYLIKNIILFFGVNQSLPGVFTDNPYINAVNGSLWTLPFEVKMYFYLTVIGLSIAFIEKKSFLKISKHAFILIAVMALGIYILNYFYSVNSYNFSRLFYMFFVGAACYQLREKIILSHKYFLFSLLVVLISTMQKSVFFLSYIVLLPYIVFYLAYIPKGAIRKFNSLGDYSYGIYIYSFPIQQSLIASIPNLTVLSMIIYSFFATLFFSFLSWHLVESKALKLKNNIPFITHILSQYWNILKLSYTAKSK
ncbi:acyltransferase [Colwellia sp. MB3u-4]|uniref:acyltransferase family protein n=1 Tax=Colwellia sp. MB3u-4 TaxID=2759822 RepID=UPI0015F5A485|nr:acyltransferase [Colwellia sp. MB3u-4]MBA6290430.1 acyltransferase [Colwellia sp. MB3u-4]